ncbi:hypothetical protein SPOG_03879 [Schizosaccharomyces cryophilus OY26]|uniref:Uncharacterized protein n=1 Tax=Schizosaccharomyces cryophilus (strain OY26 / ATCC MYA-4695 / CBS 11777 / NBRC 106824 / NRRL Y48691) TaxID=653667 RepID=S9X8C8_SCHCR|nr:uncharacterized protein SPOG_03879 [Schizosaccharomyces cryophilus OY26]EPY53352.1 hypothetical protein SPOG_03879 [Schizosaccharomyces cryophilus OY26]
MKKYFKGYSTKRNVGKDGSKADENLESALSRHDEMKEKPSNRSFSREDVFLEDKMKELDSILRANDNYLHNEPVKNKQSTHSVLSPKDLNIQSKVNKNSRMFLKSDFSLPIIEDPTMSDSNLYKDKQRIRKLEKEKEKNYKNSSSYTPCSQKQQSYFGSSDQHRPFSSLQLFGNSLLNSRDEKSNPMFNSSSFCVTSTPVAPRGRNASIMPYNRVSTPKSLLDEDHSMEKYILRIHELERMLTDERHLNANHEKVIAEMKVQLKTLRNEFQFAKKLFMNALAEHQEIINNSKSCQLQSSHLA